MEDFDTTIKIIVVGNGHVGKTSFTTRYCKNAYSGEYKKTIGANYLEKRDVELESGEIVNMMIYDTAGQEEYGALTRSHFHGAGAAILVFSSTDRNSFLALKDWKERVLTDCDENIPMLIVQSKVDLLTLGTGSQENPEDENSIDTNIISQTEIDDMAKELQLPIFKVSSSTNYNVKEVFETLCDMYITGGHKFDESFLSNISEASPEKSNSSKSETNTDYNKDNNDTTSNVKNTNGINNGNTEELLKKRIKGISSDGTVNNNRVNINQPSKRRTGGKKNKAICSIS